MLESFYGKKEWRSCNLALFCNKMLKITEWKWIIVRILDINSQRASFTSCINYPQGSTGYWGKCLTGSPLLYLLLAWNSFRIIFNITGQCMVSLNSFTVHLFLLHLSSFLLVFILSFSILLFFCLNLTVNQSFQLCPIFHLSFLCILLVFLVRYPPPSFFLFHISPPQAFYPSISQLKSWFKDCFNHLSNSGGREQEFTGAWMNFIALCLWSKALPCVKAHPSIIHSPLQRMESGHCEYSA